MRVEATLTTFSCDLPYCHEEVVLGGDNPDPVAEERGWIIQATVKHSVLDLCPLHNKELDDWLSS